MRNLAVFLLFMSFFAVTLSTDIHKRYADRDDEEALLEAFVRAVEEGKIEISNLVQEESENLKKRWWWTQGTSIFPGLYAPGKK